MTTLFSVALKQSLGVFQARAVRELQGYVALLGKHTAELGCRLPGIGFGNQPAVFVDQHSLRLDQQDQRLQPINDLL